MVLSLRLIGTLLIFILAISCSQKEEDDTPPPLFVIQGFQLTDALGNDIIHYGPNDNDWQLRDWSSLNAIEQQILNFSDNVDMSNTVVTGSSYRPTAYPNPFRDITAMQFTANDSIKVKFAVVDSTGHVYMTFAQKFKGVKTFNLDFSNAATFPTGMSLRYYFSFSAAAQANFKAGHGDVKICRTFTGSGDVTACFN